ncbi:MAG: type II toxin-antitoxin system VapC family toxin [Verrucomicrobia subdivision 3 bacterium]|nr:type II toxin-antitoxin system VapC family toxin [Limisphaerales bacterium]
MIPDTTFLSDLRREHEQGQRGPARRFLAQHRRQAFSLTAASVGEVSVNFDSEAARAFLYPYRVLRLNPQIAYTAAAVDRELIAIGQRLGESDTWIAGFCRYYGQPLVSRDVALDRVPRLRRLEY